MSEATTPTRSKSQEAQIGRVFMLYELTEEERETCDGLAYAHRMLALKVIEVCGQNRESNLAIRLLEEALDWAVKAVVRYPSPKGSEGGE